MFICSDGSHCIDRRYNCDKDYDCKDKSDEDPKVCCTYTKSINTFDPCCPLKGRTYLNKPAAESYRFVQVCMTFYWISGVKGLNQNK